jgi:hypothetical protein
VCDTYINLRTGERNEARQMAHAAGTFTVKSWDENTIQELDGGRKLTRASVAFSIEGDLTAEASWEAVMCYRTDGTAIFSGFQLTTGTLAGRDGSFVLRADGEFAGGEALTSWQVVVGSGTGGFEGLTGSGSAVAGANPPGTFTLDYAFA